jgi:hypothetical protein
MRRHVAICREVFTDVSAESNRDPIPASGHRHQLPAGYGIAKTAVLGGLHHEYRLVKEAA